MPIEFTVLLLLRSRCGHLAQIQPAVSGMARGGSQWLWIEDSSVTTLQLASEGETPKSFNRAVLTLDGASGKLCWLHGRVERLSGAAAGTLSAECRRMIHQHLN